MEKAKFFIRKKSSSLKHPPAGLISNFYDVNGLFTKNVPLPRQKIFVKYHLPQRKRTIDGYLKQK